MHHTLSGSGLINLLPRHSQNNSYALTNLPFRTSPTALSRAPPALCGQEVRRLFCRSTAHLHPLSSGASSVAGSSSTATSPTNCWQMENTWTLAVVKPLTNRRPAVLLGISGTSLMESVLRLQLMLNTPLYHFSSAWHSMASRDPATLSSRRTMVATTAHCHPSAWMQRPHTFQNIWLKLAVIHKDSGNKVQRVCRFQNSAPSHLLHIHGFSLSRMGSQLHFSVTIDDKHATCPPSTRAGPGYS